jgi:glycosyltransferase involved in cell wall biosynthesis
MMPNPTISIAMPFFNGARTLSLAIRSMLQQSFEDFELLLCDDGSTDNSAEVIRSFKDLRVIFWSDGRRRRLAARLNECIDRARGQYLARMDADDVAFPDRLAVQLRTLQQNPELDLCGGPAIVFGESGTPLWQFTPAPQHAGIVAHPARGFPLWHPTWMGRIEWFRTWRYEETALLAQDQELLLRSYRQSRFANVTETVLGYRQERVSLKKLARYKVLWSRYVFHHEGHTMSAVDKTRFLLVQGARLAANCIAAVGGPTRALGRQGASSLTDAERIAWQRVWNSVSEPDSSAFGSSLLPDPATGFLQAGGD